jgi:hypothetical protein
MGWGEDSEANKKLGRGGNNPGFSKSGLASHSGTSRIGLRCPHKKSEKALGESPLDVPGWSCGSSSLNTRLTSSLRILLFRVTAPKSCGFSWTRAARVASGARSLPAPPTDYYRLGPVRA